MRIARFRNSSGEPGFGVVETDRVFRLDHRIASFESVLTEPPPPYGMKRRR